METCPTCNPQNKRKNIYNHESTNIPLATNNQYYGQQGKRVKNLADESTHLQSDEHKKNQKNMVL